MTLAAVVLAAGRSARMGEANKLLLDLGSEPVLARTLRQVQACGFEDAIVVTGHEAEEVESLARCAGFRTTQAEAWREGLGASLRAGVAAAGVEVDGYVIVLGDMPLVQPDTVKRLVETFAAADRPIVRPIRQKQPGHPVLFHRVYRDELLALRGDEGAQAVVLRHRDRLHLVETDDAGVVLDADTPEALQTLRDRLETMR